MAILRSGGYDRLCLEIAGPLEDPATGEMTQYARALRAMIARLKLEGHVKLVGVIYGDHEKARLLARAKMLLYLSVTVEEAYPKASIEALGNGDSGDCRAVGRIHRNGGGGREIGAPVPQMH